MEETLHKSNSTVLTSRRGTHTFCRHSISVWLMRKELGLPSLPLSLYSVVSSLHVWLVQGNGTKKNKGK